MLTSLKVCTSCGEEKSHNEFYNKQSRCKLCHAAHAKQWAKDHHGSRKYRLMTPEAQRNAQLRHKYGIDQADYDAMVTEQDGRCAICRQLPRLVVGTRYPLVVDHDHVTRKCRGLLCFNCNVAIGHMNNDIEVLKAAIKYLEDHNA